MSLYICIYVWSVCMDTYFMMLYDMEINFDQNGHWLWLAFYFIFFYSFFGQALFIATPRSCLLCLGKGVGHACITVTTKLGRHSRACQEMFATKHGWHDIKMTVVFLTKQRKMIVQWLRLPYTTINSGRRNMNIKVHLSTLNMKSRNKDMLKTLILSHTFFLEEIILHFALRYLG